MYLSDYLHDIPLKALKRIAERLGISVEYQARIKLMNAIDRAFWDGSLTRRLVRELSPEQRRVLAIVAFSYGAGVSADRLQRKLIRLAGTDCVNFPGVLDDLQLTALVGGISLPEPLYFTPRGVAEQVRAILLEEAGLFAPPVSPAPPASLPSLLEDVIALLAAAYREPLPLTLKGYIRRNVMDRVFAGSPTGEDTPGMFTLEQRDTLVSNYAYMRGLLNFRAREAKITSALDGWLSLSNTARIQDVAAFALQNLWGGDTTVPFVGLMREIPAGTEVSPPDLARFLHEHTTAWGTPAALLSEVRTALSILGSLGVMLPREGRFVMTETGARFFRGERLPMDENVSGYFTVQPNFEVLVGPEFDLRVRFTLELMSQRKGRDVVVTLAVDRDGIARARERGMSTAEVMGFFERHSRTPLTQNVRFSIESWAKAYGSIRFDTVTIMRFRDAAVCDSVTHIPEIAPYIRERLCDTIVSVHADRVSMITGLLRKAGYLPEVTGESATDPTHSGFRYKPVSVPGLLAEFAIPENRKAFLFPQEESPDNPPGEESE